MNAKRLHTLALQMVAKPPGSERVTYKRGDTGDIVSEIKRVYEKYKHQTQGFAEVLAGGGSLEERTRRIFDYVKSSIAYIKDERGTQRVKSPARTIHDGFADCKAHSILIASLLYNVGLPVIFRFVSYKPDKVISHVYVKSGPYILDASMSSFNEEHNILPTYQKNDEMYYNTSQISEVNGIFDNYYEPDEVEILDEYGNPLSPGEDMYYDVNGYAVYNNYLGYSISGLFKGWGLKKKFKNLAKKVARPVLKLGQKALSTLPIPGPLKDIGAKVLRTVEGKLLRVHDKSTGMIKAVPLSNASSTVQYRQRQTSFQQLPGPGTNPNTNPNPNPNPNNGKSSTALLIGAAVIGFIVFKNKP